MSERLFGSICISDILDALNKQHHSAFTRGKENKKIYANVTVWLNDEEDQFGNSASIQLSSSKEAREAKKETKATYIGNLKKPKSAANQEMEPVKDTVAGVEIDDDLPF